MELEFCLLGGILKSQKLKSIHKIAADKIINKIKKGCYPERYLVYSLE